MRVTTAAATAGLLLFMAPALGQVAPADGLAPPVPVDGLPPALRLGVRAESALRKLPVLSSVVVVPDAASYAEAIGRWTIHARFPVLIDDGSPGATEDIARFVRAFAPAHIYRWSRTEGVRLKGAAVEETVETAVAHAWEPAADAPDEAGVARARWRELGLTPAGIIVADTGDEAWTAALALAAGRGEPIVWVSTPKGANRAMTPADADALASSIETACAQWGYSWAALGDDIDAVTLCLNSPVKVEDDPKNWSASTDRIGRHAENGRDGGRWAWTGQVIGDGPRAAYAAMCSLFLHTTSAWLFEGYPGGAPWGEFSEREAAGVLRQAGLGAASLGGDVGAGAAWHGAASRPIDAGLIGVNSKGTRDFFDLVGARLQPGDIPFLAEPAIVYFVHSWSANAPANRSTVGGRWLERGAYAYLGSVQEPLLQAFVPTPQMASRFAAGGAWGAVVRLDPSPIWKLAVFGDPLTTLGMALGPWPDRADLPIPLAGGSDVGEELKGLVKEKKFAEAARTLVLLGRDDEAARLALGVLTDEPEHFDAPLAAAAIMPLFRTGRTDTLVGAFPRLDAQQRADGVLRDALWNALSPTLGASSDPAVVALLGDNLREDQLAADAILLSGAIERTRGGGSGRAFLASVRARATDRRDQADLDKALGIQNVSPRPPRPARRPGRGRG